MNENIIEKIEALPPLPKTILDIEEFRQKPEKEAFELLQIIDSPYFIAEPLQGNK